MGWVWGVGGGWESVRWVVFRPVIQVCSAVHNVLIVLNVLYVDEQFSCLCFEQIIIRQ